MIAVYAQASERQGLDAALNGHPVSASDAAFLEIREKAVAVNLTQAAQEFDGGEVKVGRGVIRVELLMAVDGEAPVSSVVVVVESADLLRNQTLVAPLVTQSIAAIGRVARAEALNAGLALGEQLMRGSRTKRRVITAVALVALAVTAVVIARSGAATHDLVNSTAPWTLR